MYSISGSDHIVDINLYGGKAHWLSWLIEHGYNVPNCFFISAIDENEFEKIKSMLKVDEEFNKLLKTFKIGDNNYEVAVRSSAINEDSVDKSYAGHFKSFVETVTYKKLLGNIENVVKSIKVSDKTDNQKIGVVIQRKINAKFSGVVFSSNPLSASKNEILLSVVEGMGEQLVSGKVSGEDILVNYVSGNPEIPTFNTKIDPSHIFELCLISKNIERKVNAPVDIEWCIDNESNELYILQCRPITTIFSKQTGIIPINLANEYLIPSQVKENDKVKIRLIAQKNAIDISNAYIVVNNNSTIIDESTLSKIRPDGRCKGYSVVLIFPKTISGNIIRHFAENEVGRQNSAYRTCQRYVVRSYQDYSNLVGILQSIHTKCCEASWLCVTIIQEIFEPVFTGIAKKIEDGFLIEVAKGHFVPKGVVPTSQYVLNNDYKVLFKSEVIQDFSYNISQGTVSKEVLNTLITIDENTLKGIVKNLMPILSAGIQAVEFGLLNNDTTQTLIPYLIDLVDDKSQTELSSKLISEGVISPGIRTGKTTTIDSKSFGSNSLELHFHNHFESKNTIDEELIFVTETPDIALLEILKHYNNDKIGFIFKEGSALSHFSIVLREKNIPAIVVGKQIDFTENETIRVDAVSENIKGKERISFGKACITSYTNPDLDGISSAISLSFYKTIKGKNYIPVYFGELDNETIFALSHYNVTFPRQVSSVNDYDSIILVDTHHPAQLAKNLPLENVVEILDHHPDGSPHSFPNSIIQNDEIGSVCTIISERLRNESLFIPENIAGILALGIVSNTLNFTAPSTTKRDIEAYNYLKLFVCISDDLILKLFESRSSLDDNESEQLIINNLKEFNWNNSRIGISQIEMINVNKLISRDDFNNSLLQAKKIKNLDFIIFSGVDILSHKTLIVVPDKETLEIINNGMGYNFSNYQMEIDKILLRKTDFIPKLKKYFESI